MVEQTEIDRVMIGYYQRKKNLARARKKFFISVMSIMVFISLGFIYRIFSWTL